VPLEMTGWALGRTGKFRTEKETLKEPGPRKLVTARRREGGQNGGKGLGRYGNGAIRETKGLQEKPPKGPSGETGKEIELTDYLEKRSAFLLFAQSAQWKPLTLERGKEEKGSRHNLS